MSYTIYDGDDDYNDDKVIRQYFIKVITESILKAVKNVVINLSLKFVLNQSFYYKFILIIIALNFNFQQGK